MIHLVVAATALLPPSAHVSRISEGLFYNDKFRAHNVWEIEFDEALLAEAAAIYYNGEPFAALQQPGEPYEEIQTSVGRFFAHRVSWRSDIAWISADDEPSFATLGSIFDRLRLAERFAECVPHTSTLRLYNAFFVSRSRCEAHDFHCDYFKEVGTHALTLIAPLQNYVETDSFQLSYRLRERDTPDVDVSDDKAASIGRYAYRKGKAVVFSSRFLHSTEPGSGRDGEVHAYLCFTFGTDRQERWTQIERTLGTQSRICRQPDGAMRLTSLGQEIERALAEFEPQKRD